MNRIFISYRSSDGKKDADRLCADLSRLIGDEQVFFDKQDLQGGSSWRDAISATLGTRPVVLLLITPDLFGVAHPDGGRRIDREDDPIRNELLTAQRSGAIVVPLLTDGMPMPTASSVPEPLRFISEAHALRLRTDDWAQDVGRIVDDLRAHGIRPREAQAETRLKPPVQAVLQRVQRWLMYVGGGFVALVALGFILSDDEAPPPTNAATDPGLPAGPASASPGATSQALGSPPAADRGLDISGIWWMLDEAKRRTRVVLTTDGKGVQLQTDAVPVAWYPDWQSYALKLRDQGIQVTELRYSGAGTFSASGLQMPYAVYSGEGHGPLDTGSITLNASADGRELTGQLWSNGDQASTPLRLVRSP